MEPAAIRRSIRLEGYEYATADSYFITICTQHKEHRFGHITDGIMHLNEAGCMISERIEAIPTKFPGTLIDSYVVMPNHIHFILTLFGYQPNDVPDGGYVGAAHRGRPLSDRQGRPDALSLENDSPNPETIPDDSDWLVFSGPIGPKAGGHGGPPLHARAATAGRPYMRTIRRLINPMVSAIRPLITSPIAMIRQLTTPIM